MKGLLYSGPMAAATDDGIKTVTRRLNRSQTVLAATTSTPPYAIGEELYVREPYWVERQYDHLPPSQLPEDVTVWYGDEPRVGFVVGRYRHARFMPQRLSRNRIIVKQTRIERVRDITPEDALREGFAPYIVANVLRKYFNQDKVKPGDAYAVTYDDNSHEPFGAGCLRCVQAYMDLHPGGDLLGPIPYWDTDGFPGCDKCGALLNLSYSDYAVESEIEHWEEYPSKLGPESLFVMCDMITNNMPVFSTDADDYGGLVGRLALVTFRYLWDKLHPASPFVTNPLVWRIEYEIGW